MAKNTLAQRRQRYFQLNSQLAQMDNERLRSLVGPAESRGGWGANQTLDLGSARVFVKRVPVTDLEYDHLLSTANLYQLPTYYNYGVGSAGLGVFRELVAHIKTTNWVLDGQIETFSVDASPSDPPVLRGTEGRGSGTPSGLCGLLGRQ